MVGKQHHLFRSPTDPGKDQFLVSWVGLCLEEDFPISHFIQPKKLRDAAQYPCLGQRGAQRRQVMGDTGILFCFQPPLQPKSIISSLFSQWKHPPSSP